MSSEESQTSTDYTFEYRLNKMYERYRRRSLASDLDDIAGTMQETILQRDLARAFFDKGVGIDRDTKHSVADLVESLRAEEYETVEKELPSVSKLIEKQAVEVGNAIQMLRLKRLDTVRAMHRLNNRIKQVDSSRIEILEELLDDWNWRQHIGSDPAEPLSERRSKAESYGEEMAQLFDQLQKEIFGPYENTEMWPIVESLLNDDRLTFATLSADEREKIAESELAEHIELFLS
jgi:hypothetical protein